MSYQKICILPLHFLPEVEFLIIKSYSMRFFLVQKVSKKLPVDYKIIVKPHPEIFKKGSEINSCNYYKSFLKYQMWKL